MVHINRRALLAALGATALASGSLSRAMAQSAPSAGDATRPNVLVILADDMGWSDIGPFGAAEIATPNLDALADQGVRMTNFHVSPFCSPTRAMLLTGSDNHEVGFGNMIELATPEQKGKPGYEGYLNDRAYTVAQRLHEAGYWTVMSGKWHLGLGEDQSPANWGFDRSFAMLRGEANHYPYQGKDPSPDGLDEYRENGRLVDLPADFYSTDAFADHLNRYIDERPADAPFFAYLAFTAPHSPLQAPADVIAKYKGRFDGGPTALAAARLARLRELGLVDPKVTPLPMIAEQWDGLPAEDRAAWSRRMEVYAAMIDRMDQGIGRVLDHLRDRDAYDNTLIVFLSDNGAAGGLRETNPKWGPWIEANFDNSLDNMGTGTSYISTGPEWAQASMQPAYLFKGFTTEGGTLSPTIIAGPKVASGGISGQFADVKDLVPTILAVTGTPDRTPEGKAGLRGSSLVEIVAAPDPARRGPSEPAVLEMGGGRAVYKDKWKAVLITSRPGGLPVEKLPLKRWMLFDMVSDPAETTDVASENPAVLAELTAAYDAWAEEVGAIELPGMLELTAD